MRLARRATGTLIAVAVLAGCSGTEPANDTLPNASPTSAEPGETLPLLGPPDLPMPAEAREQTPAGAEAFLRYYVELVNESQVSLDTSYIDEISSGCATCSRLTEGLELYRSRGYTYNGGELAVREINVGTVDQTTIGFTAALSQAPVQIVDSEGVPVPDAAAAAKSFPASGGSMNWNEPRSTWVMTELVIA